VSSNRRICLAASHPALRCAAVAVMVALAGCGHQEAPPSPRPQPLPSTQPTPSNVGRALPTTSYVATSASIDLYDIRAGELAVERASDPRLRNYATRLVDDHRGTSAQLSYAGRRLNLLPSPEMAPAHQALFDQLTAATDFDAVFRNQQIDVHQSAVRMHKAYAVRGESPTLRPVAANAWMIEARHLDELRSL
jgi:putative membrane protein